MSATGIFYAVTGVRFWEKSFFKKSPPRRYSLIPYRPAEFLSAVTWPHLWKKSPF
jgi:hypothetical protein